MKSSIRNAALCGVAALAFTLSTGSRAAALDDATIFAIFDQANMADITTARLGIKKGNSPEVRELARMVLKDHVAVQQMGRDLAMKLTVTCTPPDNDTSLADQAKAYGMLQQKSGADFDKAYLQHEIAFHSSVIDAIKGTLLPSIKDPELKALVTKVLPGFEHHLAATKTTAEKLGIK